MTTVSTASQARHGSAEIVSRDAGRWRAVLLVALVVLAVATLLTGIRPATPSDLYAGLASGRVVEVHLAGELPPGAVGRSTVLVTWHDGLLPRYTEVEQVREDPDGSSSGTFDIPVVSADLAAELTGLTPTGELRVTSQEHRAGSWGELYGWRVPTGISLAGLTWLLATLVTLVAGPEPRWATRWAWFWLFTGTGGLATVVFPVLGLPRAGQPAQPRGRRLTGGWAFLVALILPGGTTA